MQRFVDDRYKLWEKIVETVGQRDMGRYLVHTFLLWTASVFSSLHLQRKIEMHATKGVS